MIHIVLGTKAQLIKMAPVMKSLAEKGLPYRFISTGQHRGTMNDILENFNLKKPDYVLYDGPDIVSVPKMIIWAIKIMWKSWRDRETIFSGDRAGIVLVHGDTFSTFVGAIIGKIAKQKIGHVESGLSSYNLLSPFPEEVIRRITFYISDIYFCPGEWAIKNLEKHNGIKINTDINTLADALLLATSAIDNAKIDIPSVPYAVVTLHRFENIFNRKALTRIVGIIERISQDHFLIFIMHKPTEKKLKEFGFHEYLKKNANIEFRQRYDYFSFIRLLVSAEFVVSDGGSNQEECAYIGKPVLLLRSVTERQDGLGENCVLSGYDMAVVDNFVARYKILRRTPTILKTSASSIIAETCRPFFTDSDKCNT